MSLAEVQASQDKAHHQVIEACKELKRKILATDDALLQSSLDLEAVKKAHENDLREMASEMNRKVQAHKECLKQAQGELDTRRRENEGLRRHLRRLVELQRTLSVPIFSADGGEVSREQGAKCEEGFKADEKEKEMLAGVASEQLGEIIQLDSDDSVEEDSSGANPACQEDEALSADQCKKRKKTCGHIVIPPISDPTTVILSVGSSPVKSSLENACSKRPRSIMELMLRESGAAAPEVVNASPVDPAAGDGETGKVGSLKSEECNTPRDPPVLDVCLLEGTHFQVSPGRFQDGAPKSVPRSPDDTQVPSFLQCDSHILPNPSEVTVQVSEFEGEDSRGEPGVCRNKEDDGTWKEIMEDDIRLYVCKLGSNYNCNQKFMDLRSLNTHRKEYHRWQQILGKRGRPPKTVPCAGDRMGPKEEYHQMTKVQTRKRRKAQIQSYSLKRKHLRESVPEVRQRENYVSSKTKFLLTMSSRIEREMREKEYPEKLALDPCHTRLPIHLAVTEPTDFSLQGWHDEQGLNSEPFTRVFTHFSPTLFHQLKERLKSSLASKHSGVKERHKEGSEAKAVMKGRVRNPLQTGSGTHTTCAVALKTAAETKNEQEALKSMMSAFGKASFRNDASEKLRARLKTDIELYVRSSEARAAALQAVQHQFRVRRARELFTDWELRHWRFQPPGELDPASGSARLGTANDALLQADCVEEVVRLVHVKPSPRVDKQATVQPKGEVTLHSEPALEGRSCEIFCKETGHWSPGDVIRYTHCDGKHLVVFRDGRIQCITLAPAQKLLLPLH